MACVLTATQRMRLQELSLKLFGTSSKWQKVMRDTKIPQAELDRESTVDPNDPKFKMIYRAPTIEETILALEDNLAASELSRLPMPELVATLAKKFHNSSLNVRVAVQIAERDLPEAEELYGLLDPEVAARVKSLVVGERVNVPGAFVVRGIDFLSELVYLKDPSFREPEMIGVTSDAASTNN